MNMPEIRSASSPTANVAVQSDWRLFPTWPCRIHRPEQPASFIGEYNGIEHWIYSQSVCYLAEVAVLKTAESN